MNRYMMVLLLGTGAVGAAMTAAVPTAYAIPVFDGANYAQNLLTAARTLQQINQQIQSLQKRGADAGQSGARTSRASTSPSSTSFARTSARSTD